LDVDAQKLHAVAQILLDEWNSQELPNALTRLGDALEQAVNTPNESTAASFKSTRDGLYEVLDQSVMPGLVPSYARIAESISASEWAGPGLRMGVDALLSREGLVPGAALDELRVLTKSFQEYRTRIEQLLLTFRHVELGQDELPEDRFEIGILLPTRNDQSLGRLEQDVDQLVRHLRTLAEVSGGSDADLEVSALARGSWEIYVLATIGLADMVTKVIERLVTIYLSALQIKESRERLREQDVPDEALASVRDFEASRTERLLVDLRDELIGAFEGTKARRNELKKGILEGLRFLAGLVDEGGMVEVRAAQPAYQEDTDEEAASPVSEERTRVLEHGNAMRALKDSTEQILLPSAITVEEGPSQGAD
jgi:hypothetical protein